MPHVAKRELSTWLETLLRDTPHAKSDVPNRVASALVGESALQEFFGWFASEPPSVRMREQQAAIELCIWMAHADKHMHRTEMELIEELIATSSLDDDHQEPLLTLGARRHTAPWEHIRPTTPTIDGIADRLTHPTFRELLLGFAWHMALVDSDMSDDEVAFIADVAQRLHIPADRSAALRERVERLVTQMS